MHATRLIATVIAMALCGSAATAEAQARGPEQGAGVDGGVLEEVTVTATRREESLQRVPVAVSVVDGDAVRAANLNNLQDIAAIVPTLNFRGAASNKDQAIFVRGLGTVSTSPGVEPTVSTVIDGVVFARQGQATLELLDVEQIEVLRGPQGTLFGKNASAGVVNIVTRAPSAELQGFGDVSYFSGGDEFRVRVGVGGPLADGSRGSLSALWSEFDGNVRNVANGATVNGYERRGVRSKLEVDIGSAAKLRLGADYLRTDDTGPQGVVTRTTRTAYPTNVVTSFPAFATGLLPVIATAANREINTDWATYVEDRNWGLSAQLDWQLGEHVLTSISAYRRWENVQFQDQDRLPLPRAGLPQLHDRGDLEFRQVSQEIRLASPTDRFLSYVVGLYALRAQNDETYRRETRLVAGSGFATTTGVAVYGVDNDNYSAFGEATLRFSDRTRGLLGLRVVHDELSYFFDRASSSPTPVTGIQTSFRSRGATNETGYAYRAGLQHDLAPDAMAYATISRGFKGPAYNPAFSMLPQDTIALRPETSDAYELGLKSRSFGGRVETNVAVFLSEFEDYQVNFFDTFNNSPITRLVNAGQVSTRGVELDAAVRPTPSLTLTGAAAYTRARIDRFTCPVGTNASCLVDGRPLPFAPDWKAQVRIAYARPVGAGLELGVTTDYNWRSETQYSINQTPDTVEPAYGMWNAGVSLSAPGNWRLSVLVRNLLDDSYSPALVAFGQGIARVVPRDDRRHAGITLYKEF
jgi:iron complex outermembrane receptor protein